MNLGKKLVAELLGTFWLVFGGCGSAIFAANFGGDGNPLGIGFLGVAFAFGLTVLTGAYAFGHISGGHFNPAVSFGLWAGGRFPAKDLLPYIAAQVAGGIAAGVVLTAFFLIVIMGSTHSKAPTGFAPIAIGLALTLIHLISIPITNTSVNPARSTGVALFAGPGAISQLWMFWVAPILGGLIGGILYGWLGRDKPDITGHG